MKERKNEGVTKKVISSVPREINALSGGYPTFFHHKKKVSKELFIKQEKRAKYSENFDFMLHLLSAAIYIPFIFPFEEIEFSRNLKEEGKRLRARNVA